MDGLTERSVQQPASITQDLVIAVKVVLGPTIRCAIATLVYGYLNLVTICHALTIIHRVAPAEKLFLKTGTPLNVQSLWILVTRARRFDVRFEMGLALARS